MGKAEFDKFADEYLATHTTNIRASGETLAFFAEYKIKDITTAHDGGRPAGSILNFGGGIGVSVPYVRHYFPSATLTCLDVSDRSQISAHDPDKIYVAATMVKLDDYRPYLFMSGDSGASGRASIAAFPMTRSLASFAPTRRLMGCSLSAPKRASSIC